MKRKLWPKPLPRLPRSNYVAWILSTDRPDLEGCPSACAWIIRTLDNSTPPLVDARTSRSSYSDEKRSNLAGAVGAVEDLAPHSWLVLLTREKYVSDGLLDAVRWRENSWKNARGQEVANADLWARLLEVIDERRLGVIFLHWRGGEYRAIKNELKSRATASLAKKRRRPK